MTSHLSDSLPKLATPHEVAEMLGKTDQNVWELLRKGELPGRKIGRRWYVNLDALARALGEAS